MGPPSCVGTQSGASLTSGDVSAGYDDGKFTGVASLVSLKMHIIAAGHASSCSTSHCQLFLSIVLASGATPDQYQHTQAASHDPAFSSFRKTTLWSK